jgi:hypothetical protein
MLCYNKTRYFRERSGMRAFGLGITHRLIVAGALSLALLVLLRWALG